MAELECISKRRIRNATLALLLWPGIALAGEGGGSHYVPGTQNEFLLGVFGPAGFYLRNDVWSYDYNVGAHVRNGVAVGEASQKVTLNTTKLSWLTDYEILGGRYGASLALTYALDADISGTVVTGPNGFTRGTSISGFSDAFVAPLLLNWAGEKQHFTFKLAAYAPTGTFDANNALNTSRNYWTGEIGGSYTYFDPQTGFEVSANAGYLSNQRNSDTGYRSGDEVHLDWTVAQHFSKSFTAGLSGYFYSQVEADNGTVFGPISASDIKAWSYGLGPVVQWNVPVGDKSIGIIAKALFDIDASNRLSGDLYMLSLTYAF
ncbi:MAG: transporter [Paracoccaceae bacterium]|nr:transporter [Paracoccaceae bacterium]